MALSKSDFILASSCPKKLVYKKAGYPTANDTNEYLQMLAKGGYIVGLYAQLMYPDGIEIQGGSPEVTAAETKKLLTEYENIVLFEASFNSGDKIVRTDILEKKGNELHIIEVKSVSHDSEEDSSKQKKKLQDYILDLAYQTMVVKEACPGYSIRSSLFIPDKSKRTSIEGLGGWFHIHEDNGAKVEIEELPAQQKPRFTKPDVRFAYEDHPERESKLALMREDCLLSLKSCDEEINNILPGVKSSAEKYLDILRNGIQPTDYAINKGCKECEFRTGPDVFPNGFKECWGALADPDPHIFDLYYGGAIGHHTKGFYLDDLIRQGQTSFQSIDTNRFLNAKGELGSRGERQMLQYQQTLARTEYLNPHLCDELNALRYPLHFIDFETYMSALPHHEGMRPYEKITFQWSCHTIPAPGADLIHREYLNDGFAYPNFTFAERLMDCIETSGTPLMWSSFENTTLRQVLEQMDDFGYRNDKLQDWLLQITKDTTENRPGRFVDMNELCLKYYFHPEMKGKTSIKKVLPAVWNNSPWLHDDPWFSEYSPLEGTSLNPYDRLVDFALDLESDEVVNDGTGAMMAYHDMMYGPSSTDPVKRKQIRQSLLNYCKLDTMAMVMIWKYWIARKQH